MGRVKLSAKGLLLITGISIGATGLAGVAVAAVQPSSAGSGPMTVVVRGSSDTAAKPSSDSDPPVVLRGSPPTPAQPPGAGYACPAGSGYYPGDGCVTPGYAYAPYDYGYTPYDYDYWPYYGFDGFSSGGRRHAFRHGFAPGVGRRFAPRFGHPFTNGFGHGFAHAGGFAHR